MDPKLKARLQKFPAAASLVWGDLRTCVRDAQLLTAASSLSYTTILSIIPVVAVSFSVFKAFGGLEKLYATIEPVILGNLTQGSSEMASQQIRDFIGRIHAGALGAGGFVGLIVTCMSMLMSAENAINRIWKTQVTRTLLQRISLYWLFITLGPMALALALGAAGSNEVPLKTYLPSGFFGFLVAWGVFTFLYKGIPNRKVNWTPALGSGFLVALVWNFARVGYGLYTTNVLTYSKIYGSLAAIPILLLWIYIIWVIILSGAALSYSLQKRFDL